ncbi:MAG TPA: GNAT family N-acetyltransferase [Thermomicrobiales bacterium]|nr:GNAT family N-acetyltransferase [Thermomicrobiales bacterium]
MQHVQIRPLSPSEIEAHRLDLGRIHAAAFSRDDAAGSRYAEISLPEMVAYPDFLATVAIAEEQIVGFSCGHAATPHLPWSDRVYRSLRDAGHDAWTRDPFEIADVAVDPAWQNRGIGRLLLDDLIDQITQPRAILVTYHGDHPAKRFYLRAGWTVLVDDFFYVPDRPPTSILGLDRHARMAN